MDDEAGCLCLHLVCGFAAFIGSLFIAPRLGKFEPLQRNEDFDDDESEEEERTIVSAQTLLKKKSQKQIDKVARRFDL